MRFALGGRRFLSRSTFRYDPLSSPKAIRLLELHEAGKNGVRCSLKTFDISEAPAYHALSYTWGYPLLPFSRPVNSPRSHYLQHLRRQAATHLKPGVQWDGQPGQNAGHDIPCFTIKCDGKDVLVTSTLFDALQMLWKSTPNISSGKPKYYWIDAMCVDQNNTTERNAQVAMMANIFHAALGVIVWLGPEDQFTEDAFTTIDRLATITRPMWDSIDYTDFFKSQWQSNETIDAPSHWNWLGFLAFINRPWFKRAWVVQELALARYAVLMCGSKRLPWPRLDHTLSFIRSKRWYHHLHTEKIKHINDVRAEPGIYEDFLKSRSLFHMSAFALARTRRWVVVNRKQNKKPTNLEKLVQMHRETQAKDPRDKIYAFMGLADTTPLSVPDLPSLAEPDYKLPVQDVYTRVTVGLLLSSGDLHLLSHVQDSSRTKLQGLPSWVPDYSVQLVPYPLAFRGGTEWTACGDMGWVPDKNALVKGLLKAEGYLIGRVHEAAIMPYEAADNATCWSSIVNLAMGIDDHYPIQLPEYPPQTRVEVLWRTLMTDIYSRKHPAPPSCGTLFIDYVLNLQIRHTLAPWSNIDFQPHQTPIRVRTPAWQKLFAMEPPDSSLGLHLYRERMAAVMEDMFQGTYSPIQLSQLQHEFDMASGSLRRVFRTHNGLLGTGARSLKSGDEIWVIGGSKVPLIMRRLPNGNYRLVGESYVHGIMHLQEAPDRFYMGSTQIVIE